MRIRSYSELDGLNTFEERYEYLRLGGSIGAHTFGFDRYLNQQFYTSAQWRSVRNYVITRDNGLDLGFPDHEIFDRVVIHHMNPLTFDDVANENVENLNPEFLITTSHYTHNAIHYGDASLLRQLPPERRPGDTRLW